MDKPVMHVIYRFSIYFAPQSSKDWGKGHRFIEFVLARKKLKPNEKWVLEGLMAIRGSRNGVFWANAIAIVLWRERAIEYLKVRHDELAHTATVSPHGHSPNHSP